MRILGIAAKTHDSGVAFLNGGQPELVLEEERFNRSKKTRKFPKFGIKAGLQELGIGFGDIDAVTTPWDQRLLRKSFASILLRIRNRIYRRICQEEDTDTDQDGIPDIYQTGHEHDNRAATDDPGSATQTRPSTRPPPSSGTLP